MYVSKKEFNRNINFLNKIMKTIIYEKFLKIVKYEK